MTMNPTAALIEPEVEELIRSKNFVELREVLHGLQRADVADILSDISPDEAAIAFRILPRDDAGEVFSYIAPEKQEELIAKLGAEGSVNLIEALAPDDRVRLLDELPSEVTQRIVAGLSPEERKSTQAILGYPPRSVGRLMTPEYVRIRPEWTIARALEHIRKYGKDAETINVVYVVDDKGELIDDIRLRQLIMAEPDAPVESQMNRQFVALRAEQPQEEAVMALQKYDRVALPVVDSRGHLIGIVTHDDVADVAQQEATEDIQKLGGMEALDAPYMQTGVFDLIKKRGKWLAVLFLGEMLTASAMTHYEHAIEAAAVLSLFLPLIISSGGNSGSQATTLIIRAIALREITLKDWFKVFRRELACGLALGIFLGIIGFARIHLWRAIGWDEGKYTEHYHLVAVTIFGALIGVVLWGTLMGSMLPFLLRRLKLDPATISAPLVATLVDVTGLIIYFNTALIVLSTTLLRPDDNKYAPVTTTAQVLEVIPTSEKKLSYDLIVQTDEQRPRNESSRIQISTKDLLKGEPPAKGERIELRMKGDEATQIRRAGLPDTWPTPAP
jgi:magnesium transporter